jgi:hypothetical protein
MGDFVCDECNHVCNTARGHYWAKDLVTLSPETKNKALCWFCMPEEHREMQWKPRYPLRLWDGIEEVLNRKKPQVELPKIMKKGRKRR